MGEKRKIALSRTTLFVYIMCSSLATLQISATEDYVKSFEDFKIKEKKNPIPALTRDLQYNVDYINNPCLLAPTAEMSPMLDIDELQRQYKESRKALLSQVQVEHSKILYHKMVLEGYLLMACMIRVEFGSLKAERIIDKWMSGYDNPSFKQIIEDNLKSVLDIADSAVSIKQCRHWVVMATRYNEFQVPASTSTQSVSDYLTDKLSIGGGSFAKVGPYAGSVISRCLQTTPGLNKGEKDRIWKLVGAGQQFTYQLVGAAMARILGHHSSADLLRILAHELNRASYLDRDEVRKRVRFLVSGFKLSEICRKVKNEQDCLEAVEADFSAHTPERDPTIPPHVLHPALAHPLKEEKAHPLKEEKAKPLLDDKVEALLQSETPSKPRKPTPSKAGGNPLTHKVGQQPLTQKPGNGHPLHTKIGGDHPGISVVGHPANEGPLTEHPLTEHPLTEHPLTEHPLTEHPLTEHPPSHHVSEDWPLDVHPEHLTSSADELVNKVNAMDNPLITAIMENKNPELLKLLQDSGSPELLQTLLSSSVPLAKAATNNNLEHMSRKQKAKMRLIQLLKAFKGDKKKLANAIKAHARLRLLSYLKSHRNSKLIKLMKMKYKEPLLAELSAQQQLGKLPHQIEHQLPLLVNFKEKPKTKSEKALELLKLLELKHGAEHARFHPAEMKPGREILDELKDELSNLGFKHKHKSPSEYIDNTLVNFGNQAFAGVGLPIDYQTGKMIDSFASRKHHRNPFQYEEDWKGSMWNTRRHHNHHQNENDWQMNEEHPTFMNRIHENTERPVDDFSEPASMMPGKMEKQEAFESTNNSPMIDDTAATLGNTNEDGTNKENLKNVLKDIATNGMDSHDVENLLSNLPGIVGHHVGKEEVDNILSEFGKTKGKPVDVAPMNGGQVVGEQSNRPILNEGHSFGIKQFFHGSQQGERVDQPMSTAGSLADGGQFANSDATALQKHLQPQKIVEQVEQIQGDAINGGIVGVQNIEQQGEAGKYGQEAEQEIHIGPSQKEIHVNNDGGERGSESTKYINANSEELFTNQGQNSENYAGITENVMKPKIDLLNLNGRIQGIEGLDDDKMVEKTQNNKNYESDIDGGKTIENLMSSDAAPPTQPDTDAVQEIKEQQAYDANALATAAKAVHHLSAVKPTTINTNFLESFDNEDFDHDDLKKVSVTQGDKQPDMVDDYMSYIHKQDAVDEDYAQHYYKHGNNPLTESTGSMYGNDFEFEQFEKKSSLKNKNNKKENKRKESVKNDKKIKNNANRQREVTNEQRLAAGQKSRFNGNIKGSNKNESKKKLMERTKHRKLKTGEQLVEQKQKNPREAKKETNRNLMKMGKIQPKIVEKQGKSGQMKLNAKQRNTKDGRKNLKNKKEIKLKLKGKTNTESTKKGKQETKNDKKEKKLNKADYAAKSMSIL